MLFVCCFADNAVGLLCFQFSTYNVWNEMKEIIMLMTYNYGCKTLGFCFVWQQRRKITSGSSSFILLIASFNFVDEFRFGRSSSYSCVFVCWCCLNHNIKVKPKPNTKFLFFFFFNHIIQQWITSLVLMNRSLVFFSVSFSFALFVKHTHDIHSFRLRLCMLRFCLLCFAPNRHAQHF